jgi:hypothetical protein
VQPITQINIEKNVVSIIYLVLAFFLFISNIATACLIKISFCEINLSTIKFYKRSKSRKNYSANSKIRSIKTRCTNER